MNTTKNLFELEPIKQFIKAVGKDVIRYFGKDDGCIVYLKPHGAFYAVALQEWLKKQKKNVTLTVMEDDGSGLEENKVQGRKVLIVNNDIITGKAYKRSTEAMRERKERLGIKDIKSAVLLDRVGLADFSALEYSAGTLWHEEDLDAIDLKILSYLGEDGRESLAAIGKKLKISAVSVKNRVDRLLEKNVLKIQGILQVEHFYSMSASIEIDAGKKAVDALIERCQKLVEVYCLVREIAPHNLYMRILARNLEDINEFVEREIRSVPGVQYVEVQVGGLPILPKGIIPKLELTLPRIKGA
ncbi:MAG: Lrp/AsnC family transcriptional regulator [bacterium]|nr:Lrp/AsnC family transcriptional regulator [Candidatus Wildermuthbacteria bacterium]MDP2664878.1 Lrp/AsnC family transcriptional regulator [bacterium]